MHSAGQNLQIKKGNHIASLVFSPKKCICFHENEFSADSEILIVHQWEVYKNFQRREENKLRLHFKVESSHLKTIALQVIAWKDRNLLTIGNKESLTNKRSIWWKPQFTRLLYQDSVRGHFYRHHPPIKQ